MIRRSWVFKVVLVVLLSMGCVPIASAQISFDKASVDALIGTTITPISRSATSGQEAAIQLLIDKVGASQTWDFTTLNWEAASANPSTTQYIQLPDATLPAFGDPRIANATYAIKTVDPSATPGDYSVVYLGSSATEHTTYGSWSINNGQPNDILYDSGLLSHPLPLQYGSQWTGTTTYSTETSGITSNITRNDTGDANGWGTLITPAGTFNVLRYDTVLNTTVSVFGFGTTTSTRIIHFVTLDGVSTGITISPNGQGGTIITASYQLNDASIGAVTPPSTSPATPTPPNGSTVSTSPTLSWDAATGATAYDLQVATGALGKSTPSQVVVDQTGITETSFQVSGLDAGSAYFWRVRGTNAGGAGAWSSNFNFTTQVALPGSVSLVAPTASATDVALTPTLDWDATLGALTYDVQIATDSQFGTLVTNETGISATELTSSTLTYSTSYFWRVRAVNSAGAGSWTSASFTIMAAPLVLPGTVTLSAPLPGATDVSVSPTFTWQAASAASTYSFQLSTDAGFATTVANESGLAALTTSQAGLSYSTMYYWRVRAVNADGMGQWSSASFTTMAAPLVLPGAVVLTSPVDGKTDVSLTPTLTWQAASNAATYTVEIASDAAFSAVLSTNSGLAETQLTLDVLAPLTTYYWRVRGVNADGMGNWASASFVTVLNVGIESEWGEVPVEFALHDAYPNPFNPQTTIRFSLNESSHVTLSVWDASGRLVDTITESTMASGTYAFRWDASRQKSGLYLIRLQAGEQTDAKTVVLVK